MCCTAPASRRLGAAYLGGLPAGNRATGTTSWSRWTPTAPTGPEDLPRLLGALGDGADLVLGLPLGRRAARW